MKRLLTPLLLVLLLPLSALAGSLKHDAIDPYFEVRTSEGLGSGVTLKIGNDKLILTAGHVVASCVHADADQTPVYGPDGKAKAGVTYDAVTLRQEHAGKIHDRLADIVYYSPPEEEGGDDLALLKPRETDGLTAAHLLGLYENQPEPGEDCWHVGTPAGLHRSLEKSIINRTDYVIKELRNKTFLVVNMGWFGSSGGPVYVKRRDSYYVVGIIVRALTNSPKTPAGCQTLDTIRKFLGNYSKATMGAVIKIGPRGVVVIVPMPPRHDCPCGPKCPCSPACPCTPKHPDHHEPRCPCKPHGKR